MSRKKREQRKLEKMFERFGASHEERKRQQQASKMRRAERRRGGGRVRRRDWRPGDDAEDEELRGDASAAVEPMRRAGASRDELAARLAAAERAPLDPTAEDGAVQDGQGTDGNGTDDRSAGGDALDGDVAGGPRTAAGLVVGLDRTVARVRLADGEHACALAPALVLGGHLDVAVGDRARVRIAGGARTLVGVEPRRTRLARPDPGDPRVERVVAANVDVVCVVAAARTPPLKPGLVDRYLVAVERGGAAPLVCLNKLDLVPARDRAETLARLAPYRAIGVPVVVASAATGEGVAELRARLAGTTCAFVGHSGVGKSTLVNALAGATLQATGDVSSAHGKGRHTTTAARLVELPGGIAVVDTPGVRAFGLDLDARELASYFPDLAAAGPCRFRDCSHVHEPGCAVQAAVAAGTIARERYASYRRIRESLEG